MPNTHETLEGLFGAIADAIRGKTGVSAEIVADDFPSEISSIEVAPTPLYKSVINNDQNSIRVPASDGEDLSVYNAACVFLSSGDEVGEKKDIVCGANFIPNGNSWLVGVSYVYGSAVLYGGGAAAPTFSSSLVTLPFSGHTLKIGSAYEVILFAM